MKVARSSATRQADEHRDRKVRNGGEQPIEIDWRGVPAVIRRLFEAQEVQDLIALRRDLHRHPELAFVEHRTAEQLEKALARTGARDIRRVAGTGVVARVPGQDPQAPIVAIRGDIDALPIQEETGLEFESQNAGVMHACGHDVHATWAVAAAGLLARNPAIGDVVVVLQPAEEIGEGASRILESGALDGVEAIFGAHVDRRFEVGEVIAQAGPMAAAADAFEIRLQGKGGHGARPHLTRDVVVAGAELVTLLQTVVSRRIDPGVPAVVTIGSFRAGHAANVIPGEAVLLGTLRSVNPHTRSFLLDELRRVVSSVAARHGIEAEVVVQNGSPPVVNDPRASAWARQAAQVAAGEQSVVPYPGVNMGGEDFAFYLERWPGCFLRIGAREPGGEVVGAHTPQFFAADGAIFVGAAVLAETARRACAALASAKA